MPQTIMYRPWAGISIECPCPNNAPSIPYSDMVESTELIIVCPSIVNVLVGSAISVILSSLRFITLENPHPGADVNACGSTPSGITSVELDRVKSSNMELPYNAGGVDMSAIISVGAIPVPISNAPLFNLVILGGRYIRLTGL